MELIADIVLGKLPMNRGSLLIYVALSKVTTSRSSIAI